MIRRQRFLIAAGALATVGYVRAPAKPAQFEFTCGSIQGFQEPSTARVAQMWAAIEKESGGRIHTAFYPNGQLGNDQSMLTQLRAGAIQFLVTTAGNISSFLPTFDIVALGFAFRSEDEAMHVLDGPLGGYLRAEGEAKGLRILRPLGDGGMFVIGSNTHPIRRPEDFRGFKMRVTASRITVDLFKGMGAIPTPLSFNEVYTALQTKLIDGEASPLVTIEAGRFYELNRFISITNHAFAGVVHLGSTDVWKTIPPDLQQIIERNQMRYMLLERQDAKTSTAQMAAAMAKHGLAVNMVDQGPFRATIRPYYESWASTFGPTAWGLLESSLGRKLL